MDPLKEQIAGTHYKSMAIQPVEFILANELDFCEGNIIKYTCRYKQKGGVEDLKKVVHYAQILINNIESKDDAPIDSSSNDSQWTSRNCMARDIPGPTELPDSASYSGTNGP